MAKAINWPIPTLGFPGWLSFCFCRISEELTKTAWITTATYHTRAKATGQLHLVSWHQYGSHVCSFADFFVRNCFALTTSSRCDSDINAEFPRTQACVIHGVSWSWDHISAWNVTFFSGGPFRCEQVSSGDQVLSVEFSHVNNSGLCASHLVDLLSRW